MASAIRALFSCFCFSTSDLSMLPGESAKIDASIIESSNGLLFLRRGVTGGTPNQNYWDVGSTDSLTLSCKLTNNEKLLA